MWLIKTVINTCKLVQIATQRPSKKGLLSQFGARCFTAMILTVGEI